MAEKEVTIKISAKNLTEAEFKKARAGLAGLSSSAKGATTQTTGLQRAFSSFGKAAPGVLKVVAKAAAATGGAIAALAVGVVKLGQRGAELVSISESFQALTAAAGESGETMVAVTQKATKGLITDLNIMAAANKGLLLGLPITSESMGELAKTAVVLGKAMGQGAGKSLDDLIVALGRSSPLILDNLGLTVKVGDANEAYAKKLGKAASELTEAEKKTAFYEAALEAARVKVEQIGGIQLTFGDQIQRSITFVTNLTDSLSMMISKSPAFMAGMSAAGDAVVKAFGGDQEKLVLGIVNVIEKAALIAIEFGQAGIAAAGIVTRGFAGIKTLLLGVQFGFVTLAGSVVGLIATVLEASASIPVMGKRFEDAAGSARLTADAAGALSFSLKQEMEAAALATTGNDDFGRSLTAASGMLDTIKTAMTNAGLSQRELNAATAEGTIQTTNLANTVSTIAIPSIDNLIPVMIDWKGKLIDMSEEERFWAANTTEVFSGATLDVEGWGAASVGIGDLVADSNKRLEGSLSRLGITSRRESENTEKQIIKDLERIVEAYGQYSDEAIAAQKKLDEFRKQSTEDTSASIGTTLEAGAGAAAAVSSALGSKFKGFAIAQAIISTYLSIARTLATTPWPLNLILAAGAAASGFATVARIRSTAPYRQGTAGLDFQDFGSSTPATLHGREAVIPMGGGHLLAEEIAAAMAKTDRPSREIAALGERFDESQRTNEIFISIDRRGDGQVLTRQQFRQLERAMGDGVVRVTSRAVGARVR